MNKLTLLIKSIKMEQCIKTLYDFPDPEKWNLCQEFCLCRPQTPEEDPTCMSRETVELFCAVSRNKTIQMFLKSIIFIIMCNNSCVGVRKIHVYVISSIVGKRVPPPSFTRKKLIRIHHCRHHHRCRY